MKARAYLLIFGIPICVTTLSVREKQDKNVEITVSGGVEFVLTNPGGKRSGFDPTLNKRYDEINHSYGVFSVDSENPDVEPPEPVNEFVDDNPLDGIYRLTLHGTKLSQFRLSILLLRSIVKSDGKAFIFKGVLDSGATQGYQFEYTSIPGAAFTANKIVDGQTVQQDLSLSFKIGWIKNRGILNSLQQKLDNALQQKEKGQLAAARNILGAFINEVQAQRGKGITDDAANILIDDAGALLKQWH